FPYTTLFRSVLAQHVDNLLRRRSMVDHLADRRIHGEIEGSSQMGVNAVEALLPSGEIRHHGWIKVIDLAHRKEVGISGLQALQVLRPERTRDVGKGVDAETIDAANFHPPVGVLLQI